MFAATKTTLRSSRSVPSPGSKKKVHRSRHGPRILDHLVSRQFPDFFFRKTQLFQNGGRIFAEGRRTEGCVCGSSENRNGKPRTRYIPFESVVSTTALRALAYALSWASWTVRTGPKHTSFFEKSATHSSRVLDKKVFLKKVQHQASFQNLFHVVPFIR